MELASLLFPKTVAVIGASRRPGRVGHDIVANLQNGDFGGRIIPVNPQARNILGLKCYRAADEVPGGVDLSIIAVPAPAVVGAVASAIKAQTKAIVVITAGFKETGPEGAKREHEIVQLCRQNRVRLLGPNCLGLINSHHRMNASFARGMPRAGGISVVSQSGALCTAVLDWAIAHHVGLAKLISMGNKADLNENDWLVALAEDDETKVIASYLESIESGREFIKAAEAASSKKPVVILKSGVTEVGRRAASSHTGSLAGGELAYGAAFKRSGVIAADNFESLLDYASAFATQPLPKNNRVAIVTNAGGPGIMAADAVVKSGMQVATLGGGTATALRSRLPAAASIENPIDVLGDAGPERYVDAVVGAQDDDMVDAVVVILTPQAMSHPAQAALAIGGCVRGTKPVLAAFMGGEDVLPGRQQLAEMRLPSYPSPERAVAALRAMWEYGLWRERPPRVIMRYPVNRRRVERILTRHVRSRVSNIGEAAAKEILTAYDFAVPAGQIALSADEAVEAAKRIGFPVAAKLMSPDIIHKSDLGGVRLNLADPEEVRDAFELMMLRVSRRAPEARLEGIYVEKMCSPGIEVIIGMSRDPQFGPMLMFGLGGIFVEVMKDVSFHLAPVTSEEALQMLAQTRSYALLTGARGRAGVNLSAIADGLQHLSQLATDFPKIAEVDINPLIVGAAGAEAMVADARMTLSLPETGA